MAAFSSLDSGTYNTQKVFSTAINLQLDGAYHLNGQVQFTC